MAMKIGSESGTQDPDVMVDINTTPLIDVMLVLLIMLIITIPIQTHAVKLNMPIGTPPPPLVPPEVVTIEVDFDGTVIWNGRVVPDRQELEERGRADGATRDRQAHPGRDRADQIQEGQGSARQGARGTGRRRQDCVRELPRRAPPRAGGGRCGGRVHRGPRLRERRGLAGYARRG